MQQQRAPVCPNCRRAIGTAATAVYCPHCSFPLKLVAGKYRLQRKLSEGGFGVVFIAHHVALTHGQERVIKLFKMEGRPKRELAERFRREVQLTARLSESNPHIVRIYDDFGLDEELGLYYVMEHLRGRSLLEWMEENDKRSQEDILHIFGQMCVAMEEAHQFGVIHRDIKPENVFLVNVKDDPLFVKMLDFGIARGPAENAAPLTDGTVGTPEYMSPEQCTAQAQDHRSDIYSMGVILYELFAGRPPFARPKGDSSPESSLQLLRGHVQETPPPPSRQIAGLHVTPYIEQAIMKALRKNPDDRHQSVREFCDALRICPAQHNTKHQSSQRASQDTRVTPQVQPTPKGQKSMSSENRMFAVEVAPSSYWVGNRPEKSIFFANPYLRVFLGRDNQGQPVQFNLLIDPGSSNDFATVQAKVGSIIGGVKNISAVFINHQDPDVGSATTLLLGRYAPKAKIICSEDTWRLIQHFNLPRDRFISTDKYPNGFRLPTGHLLIPVPSPFCHFAGAVMLYDPETQILYTGDLFGGLTDANAEGMFADESDWVGMRAFHQIYMPTQRALARVINDIRQIQPPVKMLVPQHGRIIREEMLDFFMKRLESLPVGLDLLEEKDDPIDAWNSVLRRVINTARQMIPGEYKDRLGTAEELQGVLVWENNEPKLTRSGRWAVERVVDHLIVGLPPWLSDPIKMEAVIASEELQLPTPNISMDEGDAGADGQPSPSTMTFRAER